MTKKLCRSEFHRHLQDKRERNKLSGENARRTLMDLFNKNRHLVDEMSKTTWAEWDMYCEPNETTIKSIEAKLDELQKFVDDATRAIKGYLHDDNLRSKIPREVSYRDNFE